MRCRTSILFVVVILLVGAAVGVLIAENRRSQHNESFQHLVGGLGFGSALDLSDCAFAFDPRLDELCEREYGPIPGGACFCPRHTLSIFFYPSPTVEDKGDGLSP